MLNHNYYVGVGCHTTGIFASLVLLVAAGR